MNAPFPSSSSIKSAPVLAVLDSFAPAPLHAQLWQVFTGAGWQYGNQTDPQSPGQPFWKMELHGNPAVDALWQLKKADCEQRVGHELRVARQYANGHTFGQGGQPHIDDAREGCYTLLYYPMLQWPLAFEGETVFFQPNGDVYYCVQPQPNRAVFFDSRIIHVGRAPARSCPQLRVTLAYKLERA
jgi:hypothetical protein